MYLRQSSATLFARDAILEFCPTSPYLAGAVVVFVPLFVWKPSSIHKRIIMEDVWCTTIMCSSVVGQRCVFLLDWDVCLGSSPQVTPYCQWTYGKERRRFLPHGRRKRSFWGGEHISQQRQNKITNFLKSGYYGSSSVKYIFGTIHVMGITTLVTVLACKGLLISPLADFYFLVARVYIQERKWLCMSHKPIYLYQKLMI